jgi:lysozyme
MEPRHQVSRAGIELIKRFEGYRRRAAKLADGRWTIGYGHTRSAREGAEVSEADAEALLRYDLRALEAGVNRLVFTPLTQNQYDALVAFAFNVGLEPFQRSNVLRRVNEGNMLAAAAALETWRRADFQGEPLVIDALIRRRSAEKTLFLTPTDGFIPAPSAVLKPELDFGALAQPGPRSAAEIVTPMEGDRAEPHRTDEPEPAPAEALAPSPAMAAAEAVSKRLQALFSDEPATAKPSREDIQQGPALPADPAVALASPVSTVQDPEPVGPGLQESEALLASDADPEDHSFDRRIARIEPDEPPATATETTPEEEKGWPWVILGLIGLVLFVISVFIVVEARRAGETDLFGPQSAMGTALGLIAIAAFTSAVYFWLKTLGHVDDDQEPGEGG